MSKTTLQRVGGRPDLSTVQRMRLEMGTTPVEFAAEHLEDSRPELMEALKWLDSSEHRDLHVELGDVVNRLDSLRSKLAGRSGS